MQGIILRHNYSIYFKPVNFGEEEAKSQKSKYLKNETSFLHGIKNIFQHF